MKIFLNVYVAIALSVFAISATWFGFGAWMRNQPSSFLYMLGTSLDIIVPLGVGFVLERTVRNINGDKNEKN